MRKYSTYPELRRIVIHFLRDLSRKARYDTYTVIKSLNKDSNDKNKRFKLHTYIQKHLWEVNEAVEIGMKLSHDSNGVLTSEDVTFLQSL